METCRWFPGSLVPIWATFEWKSDKVSHFQAVSRGWLFTRKSDRNSCEVVNPFSPIENVKCQFQRQKDVGGMGVLDTVQSSQTSEFGSWDTVLCSLSEKGTKTFQIMRKKLKLISRANRAKWNVTNQKKKKSNLNDNGCKHCISCANFKRSIKRSSQTNKEWKKLRDITIDLFSCFSVTDENSRNS